MNERVIEQTLNILQNLNIHQKEVQYHILLKIESNAAPLTFAAPNAATATPAVVEPNIVATNLPILPLFFAKSC
jgi:hypothetical protein